MRCCACVAWDSSMVFSSLIQADRTNLLSSVSPGGKGKVTNFVVQLQPQRPAAKLYRLYQILLANSPKQRVLKQQSGKCASWPAVSGGANLPNDTSRGQRPSQFLASAFSPVPHSVPDAAR